MAVDDQIVHPNHFRLELTLEVRDDWPPFGAETVWVSRVEGDVYRVENVPFYAKSLAFGDVIRARPKTDEPSLLELVEVVERSGHSVVRVIVLGDNSVREARAVFIGMGCDTELSSFPRLISVDIPPSVGFARVTEALDEGVADGRWDYEVGYVASGEEK